jgi:O-methyltransferase
VRTIINYLKNRILRSRYKRLYNQVSKNTMVPFQIFASNLELIRPYKQKPHLTVVECGVWRGGMSAAMAMYLGPLHTYYLYDSFEGLPEAKDIDGAFAHKWQTDPELLGMYDNCKVEKKYAEEIMQTSLAKDFHIVKGWFNETVQTFNGAKIDILRLDGDWYDSTMCCLEQLFPKVCAGGIIIIDDYYFFEGCSKAVHDYLSVNKRPEKIRSTVQGLCYMIKE